MASRLDNQIMQLEQDLKRRKSAVKVHSQKVVSTTCKKLASPAALCFAVGTGFFIGKLSDRPRSAKAPGQHKSGTSFMMKVLRIVAGVQTASSFAKHP